MKLLPIFNGIDKNLSLLQTNWASILNPVVQNAIVNGRQISDISLVASTPQSVNHLLSKKQQGWFLTDINTNANVWRLGSFNDKSMTLESSADVIISVWVF